MMSIYRTLTTLLLTMLVAALCAQTTTAARPEIVWQIGATGGFSPSSFTYDSNYVLVNNGSLILIYNFADAVTTNAQLAQSFTSWVGVPHTAAFFTYPFENGREYIIAVDPRAPNSNNNHLFVMPWIRDPQTAQGGYIESRLQITLNAGEARIIPLRHSGNSSRNRLVLMYSQNAPYRLRLLRIEPEMQRFVQSSELNIPTSSAAYDPISQVLATGHSDGLLRLWDVDLGTVGDANVPPRLTLRTVVPVGALGRSVDDVGFFYPNDYQSPGFLVVRSFVNLLGYHWHNGNSQGLVWSNVLYETPTVLPMMQLHNWFPPAGETAWISFGHRWYSPSSGQQTHVGLTGNRANTTSASAAVSLITPVPLQQSHYLLDRFLPVGEAAPIQFIPFQLFRTVRHGIFPGSVTTGSITTAMTGPVAVFAGRSDTSGSFMWFYRKTSTGWQIDASLNNFFNNPINNNPWFTTAMPICIHMWQHLGQVELFGIDSQSLYFGNESNALLANTLRDADGTLVNLLWYDAVAWRVSNSTVRAVLLGTDLNGRGYLVTAHYTGGNAFVVVSRTELPAGQSPLRLERIPGSDDVLVLTRPNRLHRYSSTASGYTLQWSRAVTPSSFTVSRDYVFFHYGSRVVLNVSDGNLVADYNSSIVFTHDYVGASCVSIHSSETVVAGSRGFPTGADEYVISRQRIVPSRAGGFVPQTIDAFLQPLLPDRASVVLPDPTDPDRFLVASADQALYEVHAPSSMPSRALGYNGIGGNFFQAYNDDLVVFTTTPMDSFAPHQYQYGWREKRIYSVATGAEIRDYRLPGFASSLGAEAMVRYSPSGEYLFGYEFNRLSLWDATNPTAPLMLVGNYLRTDLLPLSNTAWLAPEFTYESSFTGYNVFALRVFHDSLQGNSVSTLSLFTPQDPNTQKPMYGLIDTLPTASDRGSNRSRIDMTRDQRYLLIRAPRLQWTGDIATVIGQAASLWRRTGNGFGNGDWELVAEFRSGVNLPSGVEPTMVRFHPYSPNVFYLGLSNGTMRAYRLDGGQVTNLNSPAVFQPTMGSLGAVTVMDIAQFTRNGINYTVMAMGGPRGLSVYTGSACRLASDSILEARFYGIDVGFPRSQNNSIWLQQPNPDQPPYAIYGNGAVLTVAKLDDLPIITCPEDTNSDGVVDDADLLYVLFEFGSDCFCPADINCDGIVDDADLLMVLFRFGDNCGTP